MEVKSNAECSKRAFCITLTFMNYHLPLSPFLSIFSGRFRQVYCICSTKDIEKNIATVLSLIRAHSTQVFLLLKFEIFIKKSFGDFLWIRNLLNLFTAMWTQVLLKICLNCSGLLIL